MSLSDDSYHYEKYCIEFYEEDVCGGPPLIKKRSRLIAAVVQNQVEIVRELLDSDKWYKVRDKFGLSLLQISILRENKEVFDYLLSLDDFPLELEDHDGNTALVTALCGFVKNDLDNNIWMDEYYAEQLIKRGANVNRLGCDNYPLLHCALDRGFLKVSELLIEYGIDVNAQDENGYTALQTCFENKNRCTQRAEAVAMFLFYGADATVLDGSNCTAFDWAVHFECDTSVQENLFYHTYDQNERYKFSAQILLQLAQLESPLFEQVIDIIGEVSYDDDLEKYCSILFTMKIKYLWLLIDKFDFVLKEVLTNYCSNWIFGDGYKQLSIENFNMLLESKLKPEALNFILEIDKNRFMEKLVWSGISETHVTELVCFLLSYGMIIHEIDFQLIYKKFGYCDLFKILLHVDVEKSLVESLDNVMPLFKVMPHLICDVGTDIQDVINNPLMCSMNELQEFMHYCAHPKLIQFYRNIIPRSQTVFHERLKNMPQVPLLIELSRNVFRKYFIKKFHITSTKQFYTLLKLLPIGRNHEKIISYETKLY